MTMRISAFLDYRFPEPADVMVQVEAATLADQRVRDASLDTGETPVLARIAALEGVGERIWLRPADRLTLRYAATVEVARGRPDYRARAAVPLPRLPADAVPYLNESRYCPSNRLDAFATERFGALTGGAKVAAMADWIAAHFTYAAGISDAGTTALDSLALRSGVCRDYAHVLIALARAAEIPARIASAYAPHVEPQDFHAVAEVYLEGGWHLVDPTGMARANEMALIGVGRDATDISFLTAYGTAELIDQRVTVE
nr:transglutaminase family protein [Sphingopyxis indica]